jgi:ribbon-helix-helix CopG family protein
MEDQLTVRLPRELGEALRQKAARMQRKPSELVRMAVMEFLQTSDEPPRRSSARVRKLIGSLDTGIPDLAIRHREYLVKKLRRGR